MAQAKLQGQVTYKVLRQVMPNYRPTASVLKNSICTPDVHGDTKKHLYVCALAVHAIRCSRSCKTQDSCCTCCRQWRQLLWAGEINGWKIVNLRAITSKIKHAIKHKTSPARLAQLLQPSLAFCFSLQPMTAYTVIGCKLKQNANEDCNSCATVMLCKSCRTC